MLYGRIGVTFAYRSIIVHRESRLGKLACPRVNDDLKMHVDDHKLSSGHPHDYWILEKLVYEILWFLECQLSGLRPPLNKKLFPVHRPGGLKRADWDFFFMIFEKRFFSSIFLVHSSQ